jgi:hypothetical protein
VRETGENAVVTRRYPFSTKFWQNVSVHLHRHFFVSVGGFSDFSTMDIQQPPQLDRL